MTETGYLVVKAIHVIAIISWMAGILYLYRLFVNHVERGQNDAGIHDLLCGMERRLFKAITFPAMMVAILTGLGMVLSNPWLLQLRWFQVKLLAVIVLITMTLWAQGTLRHLAARDFARYTGRRLRMLNEIPTLLMIVIVVMVIVRPF